MTQDIRVGPPQLTVHRGYTVMVTQPDGQITKALQGFVYDAWLRMAQIRVSTKEAVLF